MDSLNRKTNLEDEQLFDIKQSDRHRVVLTLISDLNAEHLMFRFT